MKKHLARWLIITTVFAATAACSSDSKSTSTTEAAKVTTGEAGTATTAASGDASGSSSNPDVKAFCDSADVLATELKKVLADPTNADAASVTAKATDLSTKAAQLISASPSDAAAINVCAEKLTKAMTPG